MANENQNTGPNLGGSGQTRQTVSDIKDIKREQGDFNEILKDSINLLRQLDRSYERIEARLETMDKSTINIKQINQELAKAKQQEFLTSKKIQQTESSLSKESKNRVDNYLKSQSLIAGRETKLLEARRKGEAGGIKAAELELQRAIILNETAKSRLDVSEAQLISLIQANKIASDSVNYAKEKLEEEKKIQSQLGIQGYALKVLNKYLLFGKDTYGKMVEEARNGEKTTKKWIATAAILSAGLYAGYKGLQSFTNFANKGVGSLTGTGGPFSKLVSPFTELISKIPIVGGLIGGVVDMLANVADYATESSSAIQSFARNLGLSVSEATKLNEQYSNTTTNSGNLLYNSRKFRETQLEIAEATGLNNLLSEKSLQTQIDLKEIAGIDLETRKELTNVERVSGVEQNKIVKAAMGTSAYLRQTLGVSIKWQTILKEASSLSGYLGLSFAKYPEKLTRSLVTVKAMGLELKQLDSLADSFLDFESSISREFEAQLLTGKDINLVKAREAFLNNDLVTAAQEITRQVGSADEFLNMNRISAEALASSFGMSRDQLGEMLKQQELFSKFQVNDIKSYQKKVSLMAQTIEGQKELQKLLGEEEYSRAMSQTATEQIANFIEKIKQSFADLLSSSSFKGFLDRVIAFISDPKNIESLLTKITSFISTMISAVAQVLKGLDMLPFVEIDKGIIRSIEGYAGELSSAKIGSLMSEQSAGVSIGATAANSQVNNSKTTTATTDNLMGRGMPYKVELDSYIKVDAFSGKAFQSFSTTGTSQDGQTGAYSVQLPTG